MSSIKLIENISFSVPYLNTSLLFKAFRSDVSPKQSGQALSISLYLGQTLLTIKKFDEQYIKYVDKNVEGKTLLEQFINKINNCPHK